MSDSSGFQHESGWREVLRVIGILALGAAVLAAGIATIAAASREKEDDYGAGAVRASISVGSEQCDADFPLKISLANVSGKDILTVGFAVGVKDRGHSTLYYSISGSGMGSDRIIHPGESYT